MANGDEIKQVLGMAHTFLPSLAMRHRLTRLITGYHSSQNHELSYFYKGSSENIVGNGDPLRLRTDPITGQLAQHWVEPELAILLGDEHQIVGYCLANDLTAISIESRGRTPEIDNTFTGKVWAGSGSIGPGFISPSDFGDALDTKIRLTIDRGGDRIYDGTYAINRCRFPLTELPWLICKLHDSKYFESRVRSKTIAIDPNGLLPSGTVIMVGTGIIVPPRCYCQVGDIVGVSCNKLGNLINRIEPPV